MQSCSLSVKTHGRSGRQQAPPHEKPSSSQSFDSCGRPSHASQSSTLLATTHFSLTQHVTPHSSSVLSHSVANAPKRPWQSDGASTIVHARVPSQHLRLQVSASHHV